MSVFTDPSWIGIALGAGGYIVAGILFVLGLFGMGNRDRRSAEDQTAQNLISNLQATVALQEKTIAATNARLEQTTKELHQMQGRNSVLEGLFNGSENSILAFLKQAPELVAFAKENHDLSKKNAEDIAALTSSIQDLVKALTPKTA